MNLNSNRYKFELLSESIKGNIDILMTSGTKIDDTFPRSQFLIEGFTTPYWLNCNSNSSGILLYAREDIPFNVMAIENKAIERFFVKLNFRNDKILTQSS